MLVNRIAIENWPDYYVADRQLHKIVTIRISVIEIVVWDQVKQQRIMMSNPVSLLSIFFVPVLLSAEFYFLNFYGSGFLSPKILIKWSRIFNFPAHICYRTIRLFFKFRRSGIIASEPIKFLIINTRALVLTHFLSIMMASSLEMDILILFQIGTKVWLQGFIPFIISSIPLPGIRKIGTEYSPAPDAAPKEIYFFYLHR